MDHVTKVPSMQMVPTSSSGVCKLLPTWRRPNAVVTIPKPEAMGTSYLETLDPRGSKYPIFKDSGSKKHTI